MKFLYFDAYSGLSGDMILGALLDLGVSHTRFKEKMSELDLPVDIRIKDTKRSSLRGLKVDVLVQKRTKKVTRKWKDIENIITQSSFSASVKNNSLSIFKHLFKAESKVHGTKFSQAHLHEAGADDALIDIVGCCFLLETLKIDTVYSAPLNVGRGWVKAKHGRLPVPPPAVAEILKRIPIYSNWIQEELVTPTGAAIIATLAKQFFPFPEMIYEKIGYGAGSKDFDEIPNILRVFMGQKAQFKPKKRVSVIEANIDDSTPQVLASFLDLAFKLGALDVYMTPIVMKKNRLATKLSIMTEEDKIDVLINSIFRETSSIGVRHFPVERRILERSLSKVKVLGEDIIIKTASLEGEEVNAWPEHDDCLKVAKKKKLPLKKIQEMALVEYNRKLSKKRRN